MIVVIWLSFFTNRTELSISRHFTDCTSFFVTFRFNTRPESCSHCSIDAIPGRMVDSRSIACPIQNKLELKIRNFRIWKFQISKFFKLYWIFTCCRGIMFGNPVPQHSLGLPYLLPPILTHCSGRKNVLNILLYLYIMITLIILTFLLLFCILHGNDD